MKRSLLYFILGVSLLWLGIASAEPSQLIGKYAFTGTESGLLDDTGFNQDLTPDDQSKYYGFDRSVQGTATFNGDGTGTVELGSAVGNTEDTEDSGGEALRSWSENFSYNFNYTYDAGSGNITMTLANDSYTGKFTAGTLDGQTYTLDNLSLSGMASKDNSVITAGTVTPEKVTVKYYYSNGELDTTLYKISHFSLVFTWLGSPPRFEFPWLR